MYNENTTLFVRHANEIYARFNDWKSIDRFYFIPLELDMTYSIDGHRISMTDGQAFNDQMSGNPDFQKEFNLRKPQPCHWYDLSLGTSSYYISLNINTQKSKIDAGLYIPNDKEIFRLFQDHKVEFNNAFNSEVESRDAGKSSRILLYKSINIKERSTWTEAADWMFKMACIFKRTARLIDK